MVVGVDVQGLRDAMHPSRNREARSRGEMTPKASLMHRMTSVCPCHSVNIVDGVPRPLRVPVEPMIMYINILLFAFKFCAADVTRLCDYILRWSAMEGRSFCPGKASAYYKSYSVPLV